MELSQYVKTAFTIANTYIPLVAITVFVGLMFDVLKMRRRWKTQKVDWDVQHQANLLRIAKDLGISGASEDEIDAEIARQRDQAFARLGETLDDFRKAIEEKNAKIAHLEAEIARLREGGAR